MYSIQLNALNAYVSRVLNKFAFNYGCLIVESTELYLSSKGNMHVRLCVCVLFSIYFMQSHILPSDYILCAHVNITHEWVLFKILHPLTNRSGTIEEIR